MYVESWDVFVVWHGAAALLVRPMQSIVDSSPQRTLAEAVRWGQRLRGGVPTGLVRGSAEPFRRAVQGMPHRYDTVFDLLGSGPPADDGRWRVRRAADRVPEPELAAVVSRSADEHGCAGWVPAGLLGASAGVRGRARPQKGDDRRVCTVCFLEKAADRFDGDAKVCRDCV